MISGNLWDDDVSGLVTRYHSFAVTGLRVIPCLLGDVCCGCPLRYVSWRRLYLGRSSQVFDITETSFYVLFAPLAFLGLAPSGNY